MNVYRSTAASAAVGAQRRRLDLHRTNLETGTCQACGRDGPCPSANEAAQFLAERGLLLPGPAPSRLRRLVHRALRAVRLAPGQRTTRVTPGRAATSSPTTGYPGTSPATSSPPDVCASASSSSSSSSTDADRCGRTQSRLRRVPPLT
jgi:hypothetical protein